MSAPSEVVSVIRHEVQPGNGPRYESWIDEIVPVAKTFPGHAGVTVVRPPAGSHTYTTVVRFDELAHLEGWLTSPSRQQLLDRIEPCLSRVDVPEIRTGLEFWVTPPRSGQLVARPYKQFLLVLSVIYPLSLALPEIAQPFLASMPAVGQGLVTSASIVALMTYVIMPRYTRLLADWLYR